MQNFEVEIKSLLGSKENADTLRNKIKEIDPASKLIASDKQLNHYFIGGDIQKLAAAMSQYLSANARKKLDDLAARAKSFSIRTAFRNEATHIVVKASVDDTTSDNGVARMEFQEKVNLPLDELDQILFDAGFTYQAKWSREREEYVCNGMNVCLDRNAGYGWLAEFEKVVTNESKLEEVRQEIKNVMAQFGVEELSQDRLERMFAFYNEHWPEYYGTEKIFIIQ